MLKSKFLILFLSKIFSVKIKSFKCTFGILLTVILKLKNDNIFNIYL
jgi:hypothetical protein